MSVVLLILSIVFFTAAVAFIFIREMLAPLASFLGLLFMWLSKALPINNNMIIMWLCMTVLVICLPMLQDSAMRSRRDGLGYMTAGGFTGMAIGLLGISFASTANMLYGIMIVATLAGIFFGFMLYGNTPTGKQRNPAFSRSFNYLLAKGFPLAVTIIQIGIVFVLLVYINQPNYYVN